MENATSTEMVVATPQALAPPPALRAFEAGSFDEVVHISEHLHKSGVLGKAITKHEIATVVILAGRELGLTMMQSLRSIHLIDGKVSLSADLTLALCKRSPLCKYFRMVESTARVATYETERIGEGVTRLSFTIEEAHAAKLLSKEVWQKYPAQMLRARCIAGLARIVYSDITMGIYDPDELSYATDVTPTREWAAAAAGAPAGGGIVEGEIIDRAGVADIDERTAKILAAIDAAKTMEDLQAARALVASDPAAEEMKKRVRDPYEAKRVAIVAAAKASTAETEAKARTSEMAKAAGAADFHRDFQSETKEQFDKRMAEMADAPGSGA